MEYGIFGDSQVMVKRAIIFEDGNKEWPQDFIIVVTKNKTFEGGDYYIITCIDDEDPSFVEHVGTLSPNDLYQLMAEFVTSLLYREDEDEYWDSFESVLFEDVPMFK